MSDWTIADAKEVYDKKINVISPLKSPIESRDYIFRADLCDILCPFEKNILNDSSKSSIETDLETRD